MQVRVYATVLSLFIAAPALAQTHKIYTPGQWTPLIMENENDPNALPSKPPEWIYKALHAIDTDFQAQEKQKVPFIQVIYGIIKLNNATTIIPYMIYGPDMCIAGSNDEPVPCRFHAMTITQTANGGWKAFGNPPVNSCYPGGSTSETFAKYDQETDTVFVKTIYNGKEDRECTNSIRVRRD